MYTLQLHRDWDCICWFCCVVKNLGSVVPHRNELRDLEHLGVRSTKGVHSHDFMIHTTREIPVMFDSLTFIVWPCSFQVFTEFKAQNLIHLCSMYSPSTYITGSFVGLHIPAPWFAYGTLVQRCKNPRHTSPRCEPWCWNIHLHHWAIELGFLCRCQYSSTISYMEHVGR